MASLAATQQRQELVDKLARARGPEALRKLNDELQRSLPSLTDGADGGAGAGAAAGGDDAGAPPARPSSARRAPHPPEAPRTGAAPARPMSAR